MVASLVAYDRGDGSPEGELIDGLHYEVTRFER
jgi:hypothetical protein